MRKCLGIFFHSKVDSSASNDAPNDRVNEAVVVGSQVMHHKLGAGIASAVAAASRFLLRRHFLYRGLEDADHLVCDARDTNEVKIYIELELELVDHFRRIYTSRATLRVRVGHSVILSAVTGRIGEEDAQAHRAAPRQSSCTLDPPSHISDGSRSYTKDRTCGTTGVIAVFGERNEDLLITTCLRIR